MPPRNAWDNLRSCPALVPCRTYKAFPVCTTWSCPAGHQVRWRCNEAGPAEGTRCDHLRAAADRTTTITGQADSQRGDVPGRTNPKRAEKDSDPVCTCVRSATPHSSSAGRGAPQVVYSGLGTPKYARAGLNQPPPAAVSARLLCFGVCFVIVTRRLLGCLPAWIGHGRPGTGCSRRAG